MFKGKRFAKMSDEHLVEYYREHRDMGAVGELFFRYTHLVLGIALKYLKQEEASKDAVMDIFEQLTSSLDQYEIKNFKNWLYSVSRNYCLMILRQERRLSVSTMEDQITRQVSRILTQDDWSALLPNGQEITRIEIQEAIDTLGEEQRRCLELFFYEGKRYKEIAVMTGFSPGEVKSHIQNGKRNLKRILNNRSQLL
ncbi:MAG TPA: sigma-70 family RNA polymerase sigma factor [Calditrichia bacterium]|nr:sigma-70 family RNA polymerase sigma factor [Calditrichia bacterium]